MENRLEKYFTEKEAEPFEFWTVMSRTDCYYVTGDTARDVQAALDSRWPQRWVRFRDGFGHLVRVRTRDITSVVQSTAEGRAMTQSFIQALNAERSEDRPWEDC